MIFNIAKGVNTQFFFFTVLHTYLSIRVYVLSCFDRNEGYFILLLIGVLSLRQNLALGFLHKMSYTGPWTFCSFRMFSISVGVSWWQLVGVWSSKLASEGDISFLCFAVSAIGLIAGSHFLLTYVFLAQNRFQFAPFIICLWMDAKQPNWVQDDWVWNNCGYKTKQLWVQNEW